ncbi:MAG: DUF1786 domain-containing protein [Methanothrix sp.]|uniref:DUF1786 domain-containing protein n=1 Tax=Methanothrix sp. TaxID=90426 RepID=UPI0019BBA65D|nr:DUF1786 domain-containing protein [Methanothrix sp.]MBC7079535.1 DUF1786 domain-containing protein [Methanothrix sp.]NPU87506.1 DUF1786 domain-containing protein [Methanothrix sp.]
MMLAVDVGAGTQDILLYREDVEPEGLYKMIMPSQTMVIARRIRSAAEHGKDVFLHGCTMGGGPLTAAVRRHIASGLRVYATEEAALSLHDNLQRVRSMGVEITEDPPKDCVDLQTGDVNLIALRTAFSSFDVDLPEAIAVAVQDHGFSPERSNRATRFDIIRASLKNGGRIEDFVYREPPVVLSRMRAVWSYLHDQGMDILLMDTGPAAVFGALEEPKCKMPALVLNIGNGHTIGALVDDNRITAIFEHHTSALDPLRLNFILRRFCAGELTNSEIFEDGGHGAHTEYVPGEVRTVLVTGPRRREFVRSVDLELIQAAPWGDMMVTGCIGLVKAWRALVG